MKKLTIAFALIALLAFTFAITVFADGVKIGIENIESMQADSTSFGNLNQLFYDNIDSAGGWWPNNGWAGSKGTKATIILDKEYLIVSGQVYLWSNGNSTGNIKLYDEKGKLVYQWNSLWRENMDGKPESLGENINVKKIVIEREARDGGQERYLTIVELVFNIHTCFFNELKEVIKQPTCIDNGIGLYECSCGKTEEQPLLATGEHIYTDIDALTYENGFLANGKKLFGCPTCDDYIEKEELPIFKFLGYSISHSGKSICAGYVVDKDILDEYTKINSITVDYGMLFAVTDQADIVNPNATLKENINGNIMSLINEDYSRFDIRITANDWTNILDTPLVMCCYVVEGEKVTYICSNTNTDGAIPISYNHLSLMPI